VSDTSSEGNCVAKDANTLAGDVVCELARLRVQADRTTDPALRVFLYREFRKKATAFLDSTPDRAAASERLSLCIEAECLGDGRESERKKIGPEYLKQILHYLPPELVLELNAFVDEAIRKFHVTQLYIFGSYHRKTATPISDLDVAVISAQFSGVPWEQRLLALRQLLEVGSRIKPIGICLSELEFKYPTIIPHAVRGTKLELVEGTYDVG
jgi:hypothetical protein